MNNTARFLSIAAVAAFASFGAQADEADASQFATQFETSRTRAEVIAEAATAVQMRSQEPAGSRVVTYKSTADRAAVRAEAAAQAMRTGRVGPAEGDTSSPFFEFHRSFIMNKTARFLSIAAVAAFASFGAQADEADASQFATKFETNRTRAEVAAEAATVAQTRSIEPAGSRVVTYKSTADRAAVRAQAAEALRTGQISSGEIGSM
eukprot:gene11830-11918_t